jgi:hypothetical protein
MPQRCSFSVACRGLEVWHAWSDTIFSAKEANDEESFGKIQLVSYKWLLANKINPPYLFYE